MRRFIILSAFAAFSGAAQAQEQDVPSLMERGFQLFLEGLMQEVDPALDSIEDMIEGMEPALRSFANEMGPAMRELLDSVEDWSAYHPPEILDNGDIIIRRKEMPLPPPEEGEIDI